MHQRPASHNGAYQLMSGHLCSMAVCLNNPGEGLLGAVAADGPEVNHLELGVQPEGQAC